MIAFPSRMSELYDVRLPTEMLAKISSHNLSSIQSFF